MRTRANVFVAACVGLLYVALASPSGQTTQPRQASPTETDWAWFKDHFDAILETFVPVPTRERNVVTYRSHRDSYIDVEERYFSIYHSRQPVGLGPLEATVLVQTGNSIQQQVMTLHMRDRHAPFGALVSLVRTRWLTLSTAQCPAIERRLEALVDKTPLNLQPRELIVLHPTSHSFKIDLGVHVTARFVEADHPLVQWAGNTLDALQACGSQR